MTQHITQPRAPLHSRHLELLRRQHERTRYQRLMGKRGRRNDPPRCEFNHSTRRNSRHHGTKRQRQKHPGKSDCRRTRIPGRTRRSAPGRREHPRDGSRRTRPQRCFSGVPVPSRNSWCDRRQLFTSGDSSPHWRRSTIYGVLHQAPKIIGIVAMGRKLGQPLFKRRLFWWREKTQRNPSDADARAINCHHGRNRFRA